MAGYARIHQSDSASNNSAARKGCNGKNTLLPKSIHPGISLIASRTSPTDMAVKMCDEAGIALIGYLRSNKFNIYSHPECLLLPGAAERRRPAKPIATVGIPVSWMHGGRTTDTSPEGFRYGMTTTNR
jgi:hypothetical protein